MGGVWHASFDASGPCNGDVLVTTSHGSKVALIYATMSEPQTAMDRAVAFIKAAAPRWCTTCGVDTVDTETCAKCEAWWAAHKQVSA